MHNLPNGAYNYYLPDRFVPVLCEIVGGYVWFIVDDQPMRLDRCSGRFVRLQECPLDENEAAQEPVCYAPI
jgi:hypothetical protein